MGNEKNTKKPYQRTVPEACLESLTAVQRQQVCTVIWKVAIPLAQHYAGSGHCHMDWAAEQTCVTRCLQRVAARRSSGLAVVFRHLALQKRKEAGAYYI